jgi:hypothetical protein
MKADNIVQRYFFIIKVNFILVKVTINNILLKILVIDIAKLSFHQKQPNLNKPLLIN